MMKQQPALCESEWALVLEALRHEMRMLDDELNDLSVGELRADFYERKALIDSILAKLQQAVAA